MEFIRAISDDHYDVATALFKEYALAIGIDLSFQQFEMELAGIRTMYSPPQGGIILCRNEGGYNGCVAVRKIDEDTGELKRMFVKPAFQGLGIGRKLLEEALVLAAECNYSFLRLDTLAPMESAIHLYVEKGFYEIPAYYHNPNSTAIFFEKKL